ncbi:MAG: hypothetical protein IT424_09050, partial [Pirellulales bacterium]|nr:hypothetical protein [Pirellulales bacterium]
MGSRSRNAGLRRRPTRPSSSSNSSTRRLHFEAMEPRQLLAAQGFLQGIAFVDGNANGLLDATDSRKENALINLYKDANGDGVFSVAEASAIVATDTTDANGYYLFANLDPGLYRLEEVAPAGYQSQGVQITSQLNPAAAIGPNVIEVKVIDPNQVSASVNFSNSLILNNMEVVEFDFFGVSQGATIGQFPVTLSRPAPDGATNYYALCMNFFQQLNLGSNNFQVLPDFALSGSGSPHNFERIAYLYNHFATNAYGQSQPLGTHQAAGLQLAIYELLYDSGNDPTPFATGNVKNVSRYGTWAGTTSAEVTQIVNWATFYLAESQGKSEAAIYLDASVGGTVFSDGRQSLIISGSYNFANISAPGDLKITISPDATNAVADPHTFTVMVQEDLGDGIDSDGDGSPFDPAAGAAVSVALSGLNGALPDVSLPVDLAAGSPVMVNGVTNSAGEFQVTFTSATAGSVVGSATASQTVNGTVLVRSTDGAAGNSGPATKRFVDARIVITPDGANEVGDDHTFTVTVFADDGDGVDDDGVMGTYDAVGAGEDVAVTLTSSNGAAAAASTPLSGVTDANGQFSVTFTSATAGQVVGTAVSNVDVGGLTLVRSTDGAAGNSGPATKRFVDARIVITPDGVNRVGDPHTFTAIVWVDDGLGTDTDGEMGSFDRSGGAPILVTLANGGGAAATPAGPFNGLSDADGEFAVTFTSATAGTVVGHASVTVLVSGVLLVRETDGAETTVGSGVFNGVDAVKTFVTPDIKLRKLTNGVDANTEEEAPLIAPGSSVTWTYEVTNTGQLPYLQSEIAIADDGGTPGVPVDDFGTASGDITLIAATDVGSDGILSPGETWTFQATGVAEDLGNAGPATTFDFSGSSALDGADGNIRTFSSGGVSVRASAFSRTSSGSWS